ncbi:hypothetical protein Poly59_31570 [Rubripirellula reticaptiva]|uniref:Uncharacterized protein n=1 Tax=Rubripirellula reticaptiva TaxID=2528013 RepID=A0A5C6ET54_9BACT|nr:hypothetical protein Poly59_31570 [Rubripirellula reticaptiva]
MFDHYIDQDSFGIQLNEQSQLEVLYVVVGFGEESYDPITKFYTHHALSLLEYPWYSDGTAPKAARSTAGSTRFTTASRAATSSLIENGSTG